MSINDIDLLSHLDSLIGQWRSGSESGVSVESGCPTRRKRWVSLKYHPDAYDAWREPPPEPTGEAVTVNGEPVNRYGDERYPSLVRVRGRFPQGRSYSEDRQRRDENHRARDRHIWMDQRWSA